MSSMASQITSLMIVYSVYSGAHQRKHQSSVSLAFVRGIHRWPVNSPHKGPVTRKMFPFDDVIMMSSLQRKWAGSILRTCSASVCTVNEAMKTYPVTTARSNLFFWWKRWSSAVFLHHTKLTSSTKKHGTQTPPMCFIDCALANSAQLQNHSNKKDKLCFIDNPLAATWTIVQRVF